MKFFYSLIIFCTLLSCNSSGKKLSAQDIIDKAITAHCIGNCEKSTITFKFRDINYKSIKNGGSYQYERVFTDSIYKVRDVLSNTGFKRYINNTLAKVPDTMATKYANSVNSVHYFAQLPYGLNAEAAKKELLGEDTIKGKTYYEIGVTFKEEGGGADYQDKFVYWIGKADFALGYLAYSYAENGGGIRFREAYNKRVINNMTFLDYNNYKPENLNVALSDLDTLFEAGKLELVSKIETKDVEVFVNK